MSISSQVPAHVDGCNSESRCSGDREQWVEDGAVDVVRDVAAKVDWADVVEPMEPIVMCSTNSFKVGGSNCTGAEGKDLLLCSSTVCLRRQHVRRFPPASWPDAWALEPMLKGANIVGE